MLSSSFKISHNHSYQTPALSSVHSKEINDSKCRHSNSKRDSQISILQKLSSNMFKKIEDIDISDKIILHKRSQQNQFKYFVLGQDQIGQINQIKSQNQPYKYSQVQEKLLTFSPLILKKNKISQSSANLFNSKIAKENVMNKNSSRQRFLNPTQSWTFKITPQKSTQKSKTHHHHKSFQEREPFAPLTIHEQLYLQSRKKQLKRSAEQIIENQYFKKVHPFKPIVSEVSDFLAEQKRSKIKQRQQFQKEFQEFNESKQKKNQKKPKFIDTKRVQKDKFDIEKEKKVLQKSTQLKNYTILKQFFFYLSENEPILAYSNLSPKKLCELPSPCIKLLEPILEEFYKSKKNKVLSWLEFLSEFNLKVKKTKAFYSLLEKWFWVKYKLTFDGNCKESHHSRNKNETKIEKEDDSTYVGHENSYENQGSKFKLKRIY